MSQGGASFPHGQTFDQYFSDLPHSSAPHFPSVQNDSPASKPQCEIHETCKHLGCLKLPSEIIPKFGTQAVLAPKRFFCKLKKQDHKPGQRIDLTLSSIGCIKWGHRLVASGEVDKERIYLVYCQTKINYSRDVELFKLEKEHNEFSSFGNHLLVNNREWCKKNNVDFRGTAQQKKIQISKIIHLKKKVEDAISYRTIKTHEVNILINCFNYICVFNKDLKEITPADEKLLDSYTNFVNENSIN